MKIHVQDATASGFIFIRRPTKSLDVENTQVSYSVQLKEI